MVFGLINFLMGGSKKPKTAKTGAVATPNVASGQPGAQPVAQNAQVPDGVNNQAGGNAPAQTQNDGQPAAQNGQANGGVQFVDAKVGQNAVTGQAGGQPTTQVKPGPGHAGGHSGQKKSISEVIHKLHDEVSEAKERITEIVTDVKKIENSVTEVGHRVDALEEGKKVTDEKMAEMDENMTKFLSLYELINNQYNPFIDKESVGKMPKKMVVASDGSVQEHEHHSGEHSEDHPFKKPEVSNVKSVDLGKLQSGGDLDSVLLELDTLNIEEAAKDAVPLTQLKNNTNSLVVILSWLEYMIKRVGIEETRNSLRYYTEVLRWITPEVFFDLDKYLRGMKDKHVEGEEGDSLGVKDHIVSLYFISKLNERKLDEKLTNAVLQIIKH